MRGHFRRAQREEEEESAFVSMTDMTVSFLFIVILLLAFFASQFKEDDTVARSVFDKVASERDQLKRENETLTEQLAKTEEELELATAEVKRLQSLVDHLKEQLKEAREALQRAETRINDLGDRLATAVEELKKSRAEVERLKKEVARLENELERVKKPDPLETYLHGVAVERARILEVLRQQILEDFPDLNVVISAENDALRFQGEGLFATGSSRLSSDKQRILERIASRLDSILPCYTLGERADWDDACNPGHAVIEAVQIEGHTDHVGTDMNNLRLSGARAVASYEAMTTHQAGLLDHLNYNYEPVISVAGYGENRPVETNETVQGRATNRRIDLRFIMFSPTRSAEIDIIRSKLVEPSDGGDDGTR